MNSNNNVFFAISVTDRNGGNAWLNLSGAHDSMPANQVESAPIEWVPKFSLGFMFSHQESARKIWKQAHAYLSAVQATYNHTTSASLLIRQFGVNVVMGHLVRYEVDANGFYVDAQLLEFIDITHPNLQAT